MSGSERPVPRTREQLWGVLFEAAEIEHNLMCCYLYAWFSLKQREDEGLSAEELATVRGWGDEILGVAVEEMAHLAIVANLLSSLGAPAHFWRQNFPIAPGYHPAGVVVKLAPFNPETLDHFIYLERPEGTDLHDGGGFDPERLYQRKLNADRLMSGTFDYDTVGELYASIEAGMHALAAEIGEDALFVGDATHQVGPDVVSLPNLVTIRCLDTAVVAIDAIVRQGEGSSASEERSHYQRFLAIRDSYGKIVADRPDFRPARPAAHNPVMRRPPNPDGRVWIDSEPAASLVDIGNAIYNHSLRCLAMAWSGVPKDAQRALVDAAIELMTILSPVAQHLTELPANAEQSGCTAGLSFATLRSAAALAFEPGGGAVLAERLRDIAARSRSVAGEHPALATLLEATAARTVDLAGRLPAAEIRIAEEPVESEIPQPAPVVAGAATGPTGKVERVAGRELDLIFATDRCIHARHCVLTLPEVFKANVVGPWLDPDASTTEQLVTVAHLCPSGAVRYERKDGGPDEAAPEVNLVQLRENGPLGVRADVVLDGERVGFRMTLCRCGASRNKPFCDGGHKDAGFAATGEPPTRDSEPLAERGGALAIDPERNGPLVVRGNLEICAGTGRTVNRVQTARLCRCGGSSNKPFCDGTHRRNGFTSE